MRLVSYNILDGGLGRTNELYEVIASARPDVVALVEADDEGVVIDLAGRLRMDYVGGVGQAHAVALLSLWPITETVNHALLRPEAGRCLLEATVQSPNGPTWPIGIVHLTARASEAAEAQRELEVAALLDAFRPHRERQVPHLLCGDFNANAPSQRIDLARASPRTQREAAENGGDVPRRVVRRLLDAGYVDTLHAFDADHADTTGTFKTECPQQRVDYVFAYGLDRPRIGQAWIDNRDAARHASDHFPIGVELS